MIATVREWRDEEGWGVMSAEEAPGGIFVHFSNIEMEGRKSLKTGEQVEIEVEGPFPPLLGPEACRYAASVVRPMR